MSEPMIPYGNHEGNAETAILLTLCGQRGAGVKTIHRLLTALDRCGVSLSEAAGRSAARIFRTHPQVHPRFIALLEACTADALRTSGRALETVRGQGVTPVSCRDGDYPAAFRTFLGEAAPPLVYISGNPRLFSDLGGAVAGARIPSRIGQATARKCARLITEHGWVLVSGGAAGIDHAAHQEAIRNGSRTIIMLPQGALTYRLPAAWKRAMEQGRLALLSEVFPGAAWQVYAAVSRNALISAQSRCVCVIEPRKLGGSILTARHALTQGKPVFVSAPSALPSDLADQVRSIGDLETALAESDDCAAHLHPPQAPPHQETLWETPGNYRSE